VRRCIVTGSVRPKAELVRFVVGPAGEIVPDAEECLPGRGLWVLADGATLAHAISRNAFARAARRPVRVDADLLAHVVGLLRRRCLDLVGLARRAGQAVAGFEKVHAALGRENVALLLAASDGAEDGRAKLRAVAADVPVIALFDAAALGAALGRDRSVHAAILEGGLARRLVVECARLASLAAAPDTELPSHHLYAIGPAAADRALNDGRAGQR
jgi:predicted RNA-binding protein YlxR (DUF448 family)/ribosomal protein L7Ae-like RNA K-turn-binding protein